MSLKKPRNSSDGHSAGPSRIMARPTLPLPIRDWMEDFISQNCIRRQIKAEPWSFFTAKTSMSPCKKSLRQEARSTNQFFHFRADDDFTSPNRVAMSSRCGLNPNPDSWIKTHQPTKIPHIVSWISYLAEIRYLSEILLGLNKINSTIARRII